MSTSALRCRVTHNYVRIAQYYENLEAGLISVSWRFGASVFALSLVCGALSGCGQRISREVMGTVLKAHGVISITAREKSIPPRSVDNDSLIHVSDRLETGPAASLDLAPIPGTLVRLGGNSDLLVEELTVAKDGNEMIDEMKSREARLRLFRGTLFVSVGRAGRHSQIFVETATGVLSGRSGRTFRVETSGDKMRIMCVRGKTSFQSVEGGTAMEIDAGYFHEWPARVAGAQPAAESGPKAQAEVAEVLEVEQQLLSLQRHQRSAIAPWRRL